MDSRVANVYVDSDGREEYVLPDQVDIVTAGEEIRDIPITLSLHIIRHFSAGLYSSPNKAFEELITNAYDAGADKVQVLFPHNLEKPDAAMWSSRQAWRPVRDTRE